MSKSIALSLLAQGNNGDQILQILDSIVADNLVEVADSSEEEVAV